jgi:hypothetical protein
MHPDKTKVLYAPDKTWRLPRVQSDWKGPR